MTDRNRNQSQQDRNQQQSSQERQHTAPRRDDNMTDESLESTSRGRSTNRDSADDRGLGRDRDRRSFSGDREHDELGSEIDDNRAVEDNEDVDEELGGPDRSER